MTSIDRPTSATSAGPTHPVRHWIRRRRLMVASTVRGACYGIGTGVAGLFFWWVQQNL
ncbi:hypothetical protein [Streptomyces sp. NPDC048111]|uniref:hypothetical protein n=1 Tax=Streptomyces sp. NPDC048111 TaxID=3365500 RepID=UPI003712A27F